MFQKVHVRLAAFFACAAAFILATLSLGCLYIAERGLKESSFISFQNDMNTILGTLEQQTVLTREWIQRMEGMASTSSVFGITTSPFSLPGSAAAGKNSSLPGLSPCMKRSGHPSFSPLSPTRNFPFPLLKMVLTTVMPARLSFHEAAAP